MRILELDPELGITSAASVSALDDGRVSAALEDYIRMGSAGQPVSRSEFLARHAEIADVLAECIDGLDLVQSVTADFLPREGGTEPQPHQPPPDSLGEFRIIREIGRGGMGLVYEAEQLPLGRRVALKVLASTASLDQRQRQRFQVEAQAAALLQHEHIVPVFGAGCDQGVHYYAMEFVEGWSLAEVIHALRHVRNHPSAVPPGRARTVTTVSPEDPQSTWSEDPPLSPGRPGDDLESLTQLFPGFSDSKDDSKGGSSAQIRQYWRTIARVGLQAASALDHSHNVGVFHRDIKPSNLLLDRTGRLRVTDFGLAHIAQQNHGLTRTGDLVGTLRFMTPEQLRGGSTRIDHSLADIYSLGITLYELSVLQPAFHANDRQELIQRILLEEPITPRRLDSSIPRDFETIVLKAMAKEPGCRYASAGDLAEDLRLFLDDQPIRARRPGSFERAAKWTRRHRAPIMAAVAVSFVVITAMLGSLWQAKRRTDKLLLSLTEAKQKADSALKAEREAGLRSRMSFELSHNAIGRITALFAAKKEAGEHFLSDRELEQICRDAIAYNNQVAQLFSSGSPVTEVAAKAFRSSGALRMLMNDPKGCDDYEHAIETYQALYARNPDFLWLRTGLIETETEYARHLIALGKPYEADVVLHEAVEVAESLLNNKQADSKCFNTALKFAFNDLAWTLVNRKPSRLSDPARAVRLARKAIAWDSAEPAFWNTLGLAQIRAGDWSEAHAALRKSRDLNHGGGPADWLALALLYTRDRDQTKANALLDRSNATLSEDPVLGRDRALAQLRDEVARTLGRSPAQPNRGFRASRD